MQVQGLQALTPGSLTQNRSRARELNITINICTNQSLKTKMQLRVRVENLISQFLYLPVVHDHDDHDGLVINQT